jgi:transcriptional regulator with XRE-family HTH domain
MSADNLTTGERLHRIRRALGFRVEDLAVIAGLSPFRVRQIERAVGAPPRRREERQLAMALSVELDVLTGQDGEGAA